MYRTHTRHETFNMRVRRTVCSINSIVYWWKWKNQQNYIYIYTAHAYLHIDMLRNPYILHIYIYIQNIHNIYDCSVWLYIHMYFKLTAQIRVTNCNIYLHIYCPTVYLSSFAGASAHAHKFWKMSKQNITIHETTEYTHTHAGTVVFTICSHFVPIF